MVRHTVSEFSILSVSAFAQSKPCEPNLRRPAAVSFPFPATVGTTPHPPDICHHPQACVFRGVHAGGCQAPHPEGSESLQAWDSPCFSGQSKKHPFQIMLVTRHDELALVLHWRCMPNIRFCTAVCIHRPRPPTSCSGTELPTELPLMRLVFEAPAAVSHMADRQCLNSLMISKTFNFRSGIYCPLFANPFSPPHGLS